MKAFLRFAAGVLLLPFVWAATRSVLALILRVSDDYSLTSVPVLAPCFGFVLWMVICFLLSPSAKAYIWGHELTHAFWGLLCGARVQNIRVAENGGSVQLSKSNLLITLSPYFFPFYTMLVLLIRLVCGWIWPGAVPEWVWLFLGGATWGFHCTFTMNSLLMHQPDMKEYGFVFSYAIVWLMNLLFVSAVLLLCSYGDAGRFVGDLLRNSAVAYSWVLVCIGKGASWLIDLVQRF